LGAKARKGTEAAVLGAADRVLDAGALAVDLLEPRDPPAGLIRNEDLEAVPVVIAKRQLRARMRPFAAAEVIVTGGSF
jgi:hypothetical protein